MISELLRVRVPLSLTKMAASVQSYKTTLRVTVILDILKWAGEGWGDNCNAKEVNRWSLLTRVLLTITIFSLRKSRRQNRTYRTFACHWHQGCREQNCSTKVGNSVITAELWRVHCPSAPCQNGVVWLYINQRRVASVVIGVTANLEAGDATAIPKVCNSWPKFWGDINFFGQTKDARDTSLRYSANDEQRCATVKNHVGLSSSSSTE